MIQVNVGEMFAVNYPTLEGGYIAEGESIEDVIDELRGCYPMVDEPTYRQGWGWCVTVYEHMEA